MKQHHEQAIVLREDSFDNYVFRYMARPSQEFVAGKDHLRWTQHELEALRNAAAELLENSPAAGDLEAIWPPSAVNLAEWRNLMLTHTALLSAGLDSLAHHYAPLAEGAKQLRRRHPESPVEAAGGAPRPDVDLESGEPIHRGCRGVVARASSQAELSELGSSGPR